MIKSALLIVFAMFVIITTTNSFAEDQKICSLEIDHNGDSIPDVFPNDHLDFSFCDLKGVDMSNRNLVGANFENANLSGAYFLNLI